MRTWVILSLSLLLMVALPAQVMGQESAKPDFEAAKRHFKAGQEFYQMDRYAEAIVEFKQAYEITNDGLVMGQVAEAYAKAGDFENALASIRIYHDALPEGERGPAAQLMKEYEKAIKEGRSQKLVLPTEKVPELVAVPVTPEQGVTKESSPATPGAPVKKKRIYTWIAAGAAGALTVSAIVLGLNAQTKFDDLSNQCKPNCSSSDVDSVKTRAMVTDVLWGTAAAAAVTAGVLFWLEGRKGAAEEETPGTDSEDTDEEVLSRFRLTPVVGAGNYGVSAGLKF
jgi:tetratricopeptide (TPR) repeat protein